MGTKSPEEISAETGEPLFLASENPYPVIRVNLEGFLVYANNAAKLIVDEWSIKTGDLLPNDFFQLLVDTLSCGETSEVEAFVDKKVFLLRFVPFKDRGYVNIYGFDITPRIISQQKIMQLTSYDPLTRLPNRTQFLQNLDSAINHAKKKNQAFPLLLIDIKKFKTINDTLGHKVGDRLLCHVADRLVEALPSTIVVARIANDEFAVIGAAEIEAPAEDELAKKIIKALTGAIKIEGHTIEVGTSIGVVLYPGDARRATTLIAHAGLALSKAQNSNQEQICFYKPYMSSVARAKRNLSADLRYALDKNQLVLFYQPQLRLSDKKIVGMEALLRWQHPHHGLLTPARFTDLAEKDGLIQLIGEWVLKQACYQAHRWSITYNNKLHIAVNISPTQFQQSDFIELIKKVLKESQLPATQLELEITEGVLLENSKHFTTLLKSLRNLGLKLAIDDFGTGYSSLSYLKNFTVDKLKIDKSFVSDMITNQDHTAIVDAIITLGHNLNLVVVAEGIENKKQLDRLIQSQCDEGQGYYFSAPLAAKDFETLLQ